MRITPGCAHLSGLDDGLIAALPFDRAAFRQGAIRVSLSGEIGRPTATLCHVLPFANYGSYPGGCGLCPLNLKHRGLQQKLLQGPTGSERRFVLATPF
jgi:hypothetical protein